MTFNSSINSSALFTNLWLLVALISSLPMSIIKRIGYGIGLNKCFIFLLLSLSSTYSVAAKQVDGIRIWPSPDSTRIVLDLSAPVKHSYFSLHNPERLVVDLKDTVIVNTIKSQQYHSKHLKKIRFSYDPKAKKSRLVFDLKSKISPMIFALKPTAPYGNRLVVDLIDTNQKVVQTQNKMPVNRDIVIGIDAGHGGEDPGSIGGKGNYEKHVTLAIAKKLERLINKESGMKAMLTRTGDYYLSIHKRTEKARKAQVDLLISIHADAFTSPKPHGASVWTLSLRRADSEIGNWLESKEKHSQLLGGAGEVIKDVSTEKYLARTLIDMSMGHSMEQGFGIAENVLKELKTITKLHKRSPQAASLGVLKSPDIPSILIETGFISNPKEEELLINGWHQQRLAKAIMTALKSYYKKNPPDGTWFASHYRLQKHKVKRGESLSVIAAKYQTSVSAIKSANHLKSNTLAIGQVLSIPQR